MYLYNKKYFKNYVEKVKDIAWMQGRSEDVSHSGFRTDNESINELKVKWVLFSGSTSIR